MAGVKEAVGSVFPVDIAGHQHAAD